MKRTLRLALGLALGWAVALMSAAPPAPALARGTLTVDNRGVCHAPVVYTTIQDAVDHASAGSTIRICPGVYAENVVVDSLPGLRLMAMKAGTVTINPPFADFDGALIQVINSPKVTISGLNIDGADLFAEAAYTIMGIELENSSGTIIKNHVSRIREPGLGIDNTIGQGILVIDAVGPVRITANTVTDFQALGIEVYGGSGAPSITKNVTRSDATNGTDPVGIAIDHTRGGTVSGNTVTSNWGSDNDEPVEGIVLVNTLRANVSKNKVTGQQAAIWLYSLCLDPGLSARLNRITGNTLRSVEVGLSVEARDNGETVCPSITSDNTFKSNKIFAPPPDMLPWFFAGIWLNADPGMLVVHNTFSGNTISGFEDMAVVENGDAFASDQVFSRSNHVFPAPRPPQHRPGRDLALLLKKLGHH